MLLDDEMGQQLQIVYREQGPKRPPLLAMLYEALECKYALCDVSRAPARVRSHPISYLLQRLGRQRRRYPHNILSIDGCASPESELWPLS
jgi:hypothetical protein